MNDRGPDSARRTLLLWALCAPAAALPFASNSLIRRIRHLLEDPRSGSRSQLALARAIVFGDSPLTVSFGTWSDARIASTMRANVAADYLAGRIVDENFWQISATEARALALMRSLPSV
jgi:hypothetical protein